MKRLLKGERGIATVLVIVFVVLGVVVVGTVITGAVLLSDSVKVTVDNQSCGTLDIAKGTSANDFNWLPSVNVPSEIAQGDTATVEVPKRFIDWVTVEYGGVEVSTFGESFTISTSDLDMQLSTWDGTPLAELVGQEVELSKSHTLVLECR